MCRLRFLVIVGMILAAAASRVIPHPAKLCTHGAMAEKAFPALREPQFALMDSKVSSVIA